MTTLTSNITTTTTSISSESSTTSTYPCLPSSATSLTYIYLHNNRYIMNKYTVVKVIGSGGEAKALLVKKNGTEQLYVLKQRNFTNLEQANEGLNEAMSLAKIHNKNIVRFEEVFLMNNGITHSLCIVMEYCDGGDMMDFMVNLIRHATGLNSDQSLLTSPTTLINNNNNNNNSGSGSNNNNKTDSNGDRNNTKIDSSNNNIANTPPNLSIEDGQSTYTSYTYTNSSTSSNNSNSTNSNSTTNQNQPQSQNQSSTPTLVPNITMTSPPSPLSPLSPLSPKDKPTVTGTSTINFSNFITNTSLLKTNMLNRSDDASMLLPRCRFNIDQPSPSPSSSPSPPSPPSSSSPSPSPSPSPSLQHHQQQNGQSVNSNLTTPSNNSTTNNSPSSSSPTVETKKKRRSWFKSHRKSKSAIDNSSNGNPNIPATAIHYPTSPPPEPLTSQSLQIPKKILYSWIHQLCMGVQAIHAAHLIHRDLKSENIFLSNYLIKIGDFGLATNFSEDPIVGIAGTYCYSSPELLNNEPYSRSSDIFSLGCIIYEMTTLRLLPLTRRYIAEELLAGTFDSNAFLREFPIEHFQIGELCLKMLDLNPQLRPTIEAILQHKIFDRFRISPLPTSIISSSSPSSTSLISPLSPSSSSLLPLTPLESNNSTTTTTNNLNSNNNNNNNNPLSPVFLSPTMTSSSTSLLFSPTLNSSSASSSILSSTSTSSSSLKLPTLYNVSPLGGFRKQLDRNDLNSAACILAEAYSHDPRFSWAKKRRNNSNGSPNTDGPLSTSTSSFPPPPPLQQQQQHQHSSPPSPTMNMTSDTSSLLSPPLPTIPTILPSHPSAPTLPGSSPLKNSTGIPLNLNPNYNPTGSPPVQPNIASTSKKSGIFPPMEEMDEGYFIRKAFFDAALKIMYNERFIIWGYYNSENVLHGVACWISPESKKIPYGYMLLKILSILPKVGLRATKRIKDLMEVVDRAMERTDNNENAYHLAYCAISKDYRGKGVGPYLLGPVLEWCDFSNKKAKAIVLKQRSVPFFMRQGFDMSYEMKGKDDLPEGIDVIWVLERSPKSN